MESKIVVEDWSPVGEVQAFVEKTDRTYYLYIWMNPESEDPTIKSCWICNRVQAPKSMEEAFAEEGGEPCMPEEFVDHDLNGIDLEDDKLRFEWFEEGDAVVLLSDDKILAVIPGFSGYNGLAGYSIYAKGTGPFAWELKQAYDRFEEEVKRSRSFWAYFEEDDFWGRVQDSHINALEKFFGSHEKYYAIDNNLFPPKAIAQGRKDHIIYGITLGVSMIPMPRVEMNYGDEYRMFRRMELGFACDEKYEDIVKTVYTAMSSIASFPWLEQTFLGHGHTIPYHGIPGYDYFLFLNAAEMKDVPSPTYEDFIGDRINLLWMKPITEKEYQTIVEQGAEQYLKDKDLEEIYYLK